MISIVDKYGIVGPLGASDYQTANLEYTVKKKIISHFFNLSI